MNFENKKWFWVAVGVGLSLALGVFLLLVNVVKVGATGDHQNGEVNICHRTASHDNPYVQNSPNKNGNVSGHDNHNGPIWYPGIQGQWGDIIPSFFYWYNPPGPLDWAIGFYPGQNWNNEGQEILRNDCEIPEEPEVTPIPSEDPTPTPSEEPKQESSTPPTFAGSSTEAPQCPDGSTSQPVQGAVVERHGTGADVRFDITQGDGAVIYYKEVGQENWTHSILREEVKKYTTDNHVNYPVGGLDPNLGYTFGIQQTQGCGGGQIVTAVIIDGPASQLFYLSSYEW